MREESKRAESIVERNDDGALLGEPRTVVTFFAAEPGPESTAVNPDEHGTGEAGRGTRGGGRGKRGGGRGKRKRARPDIEVEAILGDAGRKRIDVGVWLVLDAVVSQPSRGTHTSPTCRGFWRSPSERTDGRCGVWDAAKYRDARGINDSLERTSVDRYARRGSATGRAEAGGDRGNEGCVTETKELCRVHLKTMLWTARALQEVRTPLAASEGAA